MARHTSTWIAVAVFLLLIPEVAGQVPDPAATRDGAIAAALERLVNGDWHPGEKEPAWVELRRKLNDELTRRPDGPLAALVRRAAARVDVEITPIIAQSSKRP